MRIALHFGLVLYFAEYKNAEETVKNALTCSGILLLFLMYNIYSRSTNLVSKKSLYCFLWAVFFTDSRQFACSQTVLKCPSNLEKGAILLLKIRARMLKWNRREEFPVVHCRGPQIWIDCPNTKGSSDAQIVIHKPFFAVPSILENTVKPSFSNREGSRSWLTGSARKVFLKNLTSSSILKIYFFYPW